MTMISWNVKGLRCPIKAWKYCKTSNADIILLQDTHLVEADFPCMYKLWVGQIHSSAAVKGKAGMLLLIHKNLPCNVFSLEHDSEGRIMTARLKILSRGWALINVYSPNSPSKQFFQQLTSHLAFFLHQPLLIGGDFNSLMYPSEDKSCGGSPQGTLSSTVDTPLSNFVDGLQLVNLWRLAHPDGKDYSFFSPPPISSTYYHYLTSKK